MKRAHLPKLVVVAVTTALAAVLVAGCGQDKPDQLVASAKAYMAKNDQKAATIQLKNALQAEPQNAEARYLLGVSLAESGDYVSAEKEFRRALEYKYPPEQVYPRLAQSLIAIGEFRKATAELGAVKLADPAAEAAVKTTLAEAHLAQGQLDEARAAVAAALAAKPDHPQARVVEARIMAGGRDLPGATKVVDDVLAKSPDLPEALALKAELLIVSNRPGDAAQVLATLVKAQPYNAAARFTFVSLLIDSKNYDRAATEIAAMRKAIPNDVRSSYLEALLAFRKGEAAKAREAIQQVLKVAPDHAPTQLLAGAIELQLGGMGAAEEYLRRVLARYPNSLAARNLLTLTYLRIGQPAKAEEVLEPALRGAPQNPAVLRLAGEIALANNRLADAAKYYDQAVALAKDDAALRTRAAQLRFATGDVDRALRDLEEASGLDESQYQADLALIAAHLRRKEYDKALTAVANLEKKQPKNPLTYNVKGSSLPREAGPQERAGELRARALAAVRLPAGGRQPRAARPRREAARRREEARRSDCREGAEERERDPRARADSGGDRRAGEGGRCDARPCGGRQPAVGTGAARAYLPPRPGAGRESRTCRGAGRFGGAAERCPGHGGSRRRSARSRRHEPGDRHAQPTRRGAPPVARAADAACRGAIRRQGIRRGSSVVAQGARAQP